MTDDAAVEWFDSHCHLQDEYRSSAQNPNGDAIAASAPIANALAAGVTRMICVGTDAETSLAAWRLASVLQPDGVRIWATIGLHPHEASRGTSDVSRLLEEAASRNDRSVVAVGECGLDYHYDHSPRESQRQAFAEQIALAHLHGLTLVVHAREAWDDLFDVLEREGVPQRTVMHCFTGGPVELARCLDAGMFVSFSGIVTFKSATTVREAAIACPLERLLVETDSPFLAPVPHRGRPNEPAYVPLVGQAIARARGITPSEVARTSSEAAREAFGLASGAS